MGDLEMRGFSLMIKRCLDWVGTSVVCSLLYRCKHIALASSRTIRTCTQSPLT
jgi:hypothetical protein